MAIQANTFTTYDAVGQRESLSDVIYNISPEETPFMSNIGKGGAKAKFNEWQVDELADADTANAQLEGDDNPANQDLAETVRIGNYQQISRKVFSISDTEEEVDKAGRKSERAYQRAKKSAELKRDMESILLSNQGAVAGAAGVARKTGSLLAFVKTNVDKAGDGVNPVYTNIPTDDRTDGTQRALTETIVKNVQALCWAEGSRPSILMVGAYNKGVISGFAGIATKTWNMNGAKPATIVGTADVYVGDFGTLSVVPNRFQRARDAHFVSPEYAMLQFLRKFRKVSLAKTGDAEKEMLIVEWGLKVTNELAHGLAADLTTSA